MRADMTVNVPRTAKRRYMISLLASACSAAFLGSTGTAGAPAWRRVRALGSWVG